MVQRIPPSPSNVVVRMSSSLLIVRYNPHQIAIKVPAHATGLVSSRESRGAGIGIRMRIMLNITVRTVAINAGIQAPIWLAPSQPVTPNTSPDNAK